MSDFLDRLTERSLGEKMNLRPRLMPIFEATTVPAMTQEPPVRPRPVGSPEAIVERIRPQAEGSQTVGAPLVAESVGEPAKAPPTVIQHSTTHRETTTGVNEVTRTERDTVTVREEQAPREPVPATAMTGVVQILPERPTPRVAPPPQLAPNPSPSSRQAEEQVPAERTPDIEIRIGRVEVRAQFAAAPRKEPPKPKGPAVSLDQYLEGRR